ncbi:MAG: flagellar hook-associated protein FlgK [Rubrivivax sp.]|nr:flagellar hook-associated protein FlgK [Rubrivivax sp.]
MGASPLMSLGIRAMAANFAALQATGHNIANANVDGYSRQSAVLSTAQGQFTGAGFFGRGVDVSSVVRAHDEFLTREAAAARSLASMDGARLDQLQQLESVFRTGESGLGYAASQLFNAMGDLASHPSDLSARQVVLARAGDLVDRFNEAGQTLDNLQHGLTTSLKSQVAEINDLAKSIAAANSRIAALLGTGQPANDLLDERDRLVARLSDRVQVTRIDASDGSIGLFIGGGQRLVLGAEAATLKVVGDPSDPSRSALALQEGGGSVGIDADTLGGGSVAGLLRFQNDDLVAGRNLVGQLATAVASAVNRQQLAGLNLQPPAGSIASQPLFGLGAAQAIPQSSNQRDAATGLPLGSVTLTLTDAAALKASDYDLRESTTQPGTWQLTRLSDGQVSHINGGDVVDGMRIDIANAQPGDRFLLQPVGRAAVGMSRLLSDPRDLAAASPLTATTPTTNSGSAAVGDLTVTATPLPYGAANEVLTFTRLNPAQNGFDYTVSSSIDGSSSLWKTGMPVVGANGYTLTVSGVPNDGDAIHVDPTSSSAVATNNGNARAMLALRDATLVDGETATDRWSSALADVGVRVQTARSSSEIAAAVSQQVEESRSAASGVNLDEEAARLIQYQQSYQAAAKVLQVAQSIFDTLLQTAGR